jgi:hypothetical protein
MRGSKPRVWLTGRAQGPHAPSAIAGRRIASRHHAVVPAGKRKHQPHNRGFEARPPVFGGVQGIPLVVRHAKVQRPKPPPPKTLLALSHSAKRRQEV